MSRTAIMAAGLLGVAVGLGLFAIWAEAGRGGQALVASARAEPTATTPPPAPPTQPATPGAPTATIVAFVVPTIIPAPRGRGTPSIVPEPTPAAVAAQPNLQSHIDAAMQAIVPFGSAELIAEDGRLVATYRAARPCTAASTIKLALLIEVLRQQAASALDLSRSVTIRAGDIVGGTGDLQYQVGRTLTLQEIAHQMVIRSDNVAANILVDIVGMDSVTATAHANGFPNTYFGRHMLDTAAQAAGRENVTSAEDLAGMLHRIVQGTMISTSVSQQALAYLGERGQLDKSWLGLNLPAGTRLSHINGTLAGVRNDVGYITTASGKSFILAVCQDHLANDSAGEDAIARLARRVYDLFEPA